MSVKIEFYFQQAAAPAPDPFIKRKMEKEEAANKKLKTDNDDEEIIPLEDRVKNTTVPLWNMPYDEQVKIIIFYCV